TRRLRRRGNCSSASPPVARRRYRRRLATAHSAGLAGRAAPGPLRDQPVRPVSRRPPPGVRPGRDRMSAPQGGQTLRLGVLSDLHLAPAETPPAQFNSTVQLGQSRGLLQTALAWLTPQVDAFILLGDLTQSATADDYRYLARRLNRTGVPS